MPSYIAARYGDQRRYLIKGLREIAHRIEELVAGLDERTLATRAVDVDPAADEEWCVKEIVGYLRDSERDDLRAISTMLRHDGAAIEPRHAAYGALDRDYRTAAIEQLVWDFLSAREETVWTLRDDPGAWYCTGQDPVRGEVTVLQIVQEMNERDLDAMWRIQRLADLLAPPRAR
jgi:transposase InsO family protein